MKEEIVSLFLMIMVLTVMMFVVTFRINRLFTTVDYVGRRAESNREKIIKLEQRVTEIETQACHDW